MTEQKLTVTNLIYALTAITVVSRSAFSYILEGLSKKDPTSVQTWLAAFGYPAEAFIMFFVLSLAVLAFLRNREILKWCPGESTGWISIVLGLITGVVVSLIAGLSMNSDAVLQEGVLFRALLFNPHRATGIASLILIALALPIIGELFFRGVAFRILAEYTTIPAAILGSSILFAWLFRPLYSLETRFIFGILAAALFYRTRTLLASVLASLTLSCTLLTSVLLRSLK